MNDRAPGSGCSARHSDFCLLTSDFCLLSSDFCLPPLQSSTSFMFVPPTRISSTLFLPSALAYRTVVEEYLASPDSTLTATSVVSWPCLITIFRSCSSHRTEE